jgi:cytoskeletal protein CcmA (bactofilin family)
MSHFDEMTGLLYLENQLKPENAQTVRAHASECGECRDLLEALRRESLWLRESLEVEDESVPARLLSAPEKGSAPWGWISALALSIGGAYTLWSGIIEPWRAQAAEAGFTQGNLLTMLFFSGAFWKGWDAMRSMVEFVTVATMCVLVIWLLRKHLGRSSMIAVATVGIFGMLAMPPMAGAAQVEHGQPNFELAAGTTVHTDLIVFADSTRIDGDVDGDVIAWSRDVTVNGHVKGDVIAFAQELRVNGTVGGNVRAFAQKVELNSTVARNVSAWVGDFDLNQSAHVDGTITLGTGDAVLDGTADGDLLAFGGHIAIQGLLESNALVHSGEMTIGPKAEVKGKLKYEGRKPPDVSPSAKFGTPMETVLKMEDSEGSKYSSPMYYWHQVLKWAAGFVFGLALLLLAPGFFFDAASACRKYAPALGFGVLLLFATPIAAVIVCVTIVGLGVGITAMLLWLIALYAAHVVVGLWLGETILGAGVGVGAALARLALGLLILRIVFMLPFVGGWVGLLVIIWGIGALALATRKTVQPHMAAAV